MAKRLLSALLALCMGITLFPTAVIASAADPITVDDFSVPTYISTGNEDDTDSEDVTEPSNPDPYANISSNISDETALRNAIDAINKGSGGTYEIILSHEIKLTKDLKVTNLAASVTIKDDPKTFDSSQDSALISVSDPITLSNITLANGGFFQKQNQSTSTDPTQSYDTWLDYPLLSVSGGAIVTLEFCTIDGNPSSSFSPDDLSCRGLRLWSGATVTMDSCRIQNCHAGGSSGAGVLVSEGASLEMSNSTITNCTAQDGGGAALSDSNSKLVLNNSQIENCSANSNGGGVALSGSDSKLELNGNSAITNCKANQNGGGISAGSSTNVSVEMHDSSSISDCHTTNYGGGVYLQGDTSSLTMDGSSSIQNCYTTVNTSSNGGGAYLAGDHNTLIMSGSSKIAGCSAHEGGGGVYIFGDSASLQMNGSSIENCKSEGTNANGGGVYIYGASANLKMDVGGIKNCSASVDGGGVYISGASASLDMQNNSMLTDCEANGNGGGIGSSTSASSRSLTINGSAISNCTAGSYGGGIYSSGELNMENCKITNCKANQYDGGGVFFFGTTAKLRSSTITKCSATSYGGGICLNGYSSALELTQSRVSDCTAGNGGGICAYRQHGAPQTAKLTLSGSTIEECKATATDGSGGGIYCAGGSWGNNSAVLENSSLVHCSATTGAGGGVYLGGAKDSLTLNSSNISDCGAADGGGICLDGSDAQLFAAGSTSVTDCTASSNGGGIYFYGANSNLHKDALTSGEAEITVTGCHANVSGGGIFVDSYKGRTCSLSFSDCTIYNNIADTSGSDFYLSKADYDVTLPSVSGKELRHSTDSKIIDGWYYDPNAENIRHSPTNSAGRVNTGTSRCTVSLSGSPCALVACSAMYHIIFEGSYAADCEAYSDSDCTTAITDAAPGDTVYLKYKGSLADGTRMDWSAVTDGDDADSRDVSVSASSRVCASFIMPATNINSKVIITPATAAVPTYAIQVVAPEGSSADAVTVISSAEEGQTINLTFDPSALSSESQKTFGGWVVKKADESSETVEVTDANNINASFTMPDSDVVVTFTLKDAGKPSTPEAPDTPSDPPSDKPSDTPSDPSDLPSDSGDCDGGGADAIAAGAFIGTAGYLYGTQVWLNHLFGFIPENRIELALALWNRADRPVPESGELYPDIDEDADDAQQAARWCVEQKLLKDYHETDENGNEKITFRPYRYMFRLRAIKAWYDLEWLLHKQRSSASTVPKNK